MAFHTAIVDLMSQSTVEIDATRAAHDHIVRVINDGWLALILSFGERLGLSEALAELRRADVARLSAQTGVVHRYVEDWLWAMAAAGIVDSERDADGTDRFSLAPGYADAVTSSGGTGNWGRIAEQLVAMASLEDRLVQAARSIGGLPASVYEGRIVDVLAVESGPILEASLVDEVVPLLGVHDRLDRGGLVLDAGCGSGEALAILAAHYPRSRFVGVDQSADAIASARARAIRLGLDNIDLYVADLEDDWPLGVGATEFDLVLAVNVAHDLSDPHRFFRAVRDRLADSGVFGLVELGFDTDMRVNIQHPHAIGVLAFGLYHCLPLAQRRPGIAPGGMWGSRTYVDALEAAGFTDVVLTHAPSDPTNDLIIARNTGSNTAS